MAPQLLAASRSGLNLYPSSLTSPTPDTALSEAPRSSAKVLGQGYSPISVSVKSTRKICFKSSSSRLNPLAAVSPAPCIRSIRNPSAGFRPNHLSQHAPVQIGILQQTPPKHRIFENSFVKIAPGKFALFSKHILPVTALKTAACKEQFSINT